ncbi:HDOD domain-containing protein [Telmatobacter bradus]|uniref:HDOD domain-containing protein n=1 Tax=Telmatobacter bradus TaxID=474953 RepID=UPI003B43B819
MKRILFVDDESNVLDGIRRMLHADRERWELQFAVGGEAALRACETCSFDVVVSDMRMPGMDGAELLSHIRDRFPSTARIVLSGYSDLLLATRAVSSAHRCLCKPCTSSELRATIERVCSLQETLNTPEIRKIIGSVSELPSLSSTYARLIQAMQNPATSISDIASIIERDVAMSAKVLQLANSAFFGLPQQVTGLTGAATYLGMATIKNLALASEAFRVFVPDSRIPHSVCESLEQHSYHAATIAGLLPVDRGIQDVTTLGALLHDIGRLFLASAMPDVFCSALSQASERGCKTFEAEQELIGTSHAEIGAYLLGLWGLPNLTVEAIAYHHHPTRLMHSGLDSCAAVYVANLIAHELDEHPNDVRCTELSEADRISLEALDLLDQFPALRERALQCIENTLVS